MKNRDEEIRFKVYDGVYYPAEDTHLLISALNDEKGVYTKALDIGCGCGIVTLHLLLTNKAKYVIACDINFRALLNTKDNLFTNNLYHKVDLIQCDICHYPFREEAYIDIIVSNPPYLPHDDEVPLEALNKYDLSWYGGPDGRRVVDAVIDISSRLLVKKGILLLVQSSITNIDKTIRRLLEVGLKGKVVKKIHIFFEDIVVIKAVKDASKD